MMHELVSNILGSCSDEVVSPLQIKPLSLSTLEVVYSELLSNKDSSKATSEHQDITPIPEDGSNLIQMVSKLYSQKPLRKNLGLCENSQSTKKDVDINDFWMLTPISHSGVTQAMISSSTMILLNAQVVRNSRVRLGVLNSVWKCLRETKIPYSSLLDVSKEESNVSFSTVKEAVNCGDSALTSSVSSLADIGCQTAFTIGVSVLKSCWRSSPANADLCSDVLASCVEALGNLPPGSLMASSNCLSPGIATTLKKSREFLTQVVRNSLPGVVGLVPDADRQLAIGILLNFALAEGSISSLIDVVLLLFELEKLQSLQNVPLRSIIRPMINQIRPEFLTLNSPASDIIRTSGILESETGEYCENVDLKSAAMLILAGVDNLVQPLLSSGREALSENSRQPVSKAQLLGWGNSKLIPAYGSHNVNFPSGFLGGARPDDVVDITTSQHCLVVLMKKGHVCQLPIGDLSSEACATVILGTNTESDINCLSSKQMITSIAGCPSSTNCLALSSKGQVFYWDASPIGNRDSARVETVSLPEIFIVKIAAGNSYQAALSTDGFLYLWGRNQHGQLGTGNHRAEDFPAQISPINGAKWTDISLSSCSVGYSVAVNELGHVYTWGGSTGQGWRPSQNSSVVPQRVFPLENVSKVFAGEDFASAITHSGKLEVWGRVFGKKQSPQELDLGDARDSVRSVSQIANRLLVVTALGKVLLYGHDFSLPVLSETSFTSYLDDPNRPRVLLTLNGHLNDESIRVKVACTATDGFVLVSPLNKNILETQNPNISLGRCFQHHLNDSSSAKRNINLLLKLFSLATEQRDGNMCVFVIDILRAYSASSTVGVEPEEKSALQNCIFQLCSAPFVSMTTGQLALPKSVENFVGECWPLLYPSVEDRMTVLLKLVRSCGTLLAKLVFKNLVDTVVRNGDLGYYVNSLIQSEALSASLEMDSYLSGDSAALPDLAQNSKKSSKIEGDNVTDRQKNFFNEDSSNDLILLISTIVLNDRRRIIDLSAKLTKSGCEIDKFFRIVDDFQSSNSNSEYEASKLVSHFLRHLFSHIVNCSCAGSPDGCPATSICRGVALARDFVTFFGQNCLEIIEEVRRIGKISPSYMLYACHNFLRSSLVSVCLPEIIDSFMAILLFAKHHFIGSDNGRPLGLFLVNALQPLVLGLIEIDASFSHFEQWLDAYVMSWQSALPSRTLHQRFPLEKVMSSMNNNVSVIHGCVLDVSEMTSKDLQIFNKEISVADIRSKEATPVLMSLSNDSSSKDLYQNIRCLITRFGIGRIAEDIEGSSSALSFADSSHQSPFKDTVQALLFAITLFSVEVLSQEPVSGQFPEELSDLVGIFRSSLVSDLDSTQLQPASDFISSLSGQKPHVSYADCVEKLLSIFDNYLMKNGFQGVKIIANENVALRAVKRYSLATFIRHMDLVEPIYFHLLRPDEGIDVTTKLPIMTLVFKSVSSILQYVVRQFQQPNAVDHSSICSPVFFALRFLLNSVDQSFDFSAELCQRMSKLRKRNRWQRAISYIAKRQNDVATMPASHWNDIYLLVNDKTCKELYKTWRNGLLDDRRLLACTKLTRFVQFAKISQITELKLRFRMHIELAASQTQTMQILTQIFSAFSFSEFPQLGVSDLRAVPDLLEAFVAGLSFAAINSMQHSDFGNKLNRFSGLLSRKSERILMECWQRFTFKLIEGLGQVSSLLAQNLQLSLLCPIVLHFSAKFVNAEASSILFMQGFLARLIRVLSNVIDQNGGERLKSISYPKCLIFEKKVKEKVKFPIRGREEVVGPEMAQRLCVGSEVVRGPDWCWGDQDTTGGGRPVGIVLRPVSVDGWVRVRWANGITNNYRMGRDGRFDLKLAQDDQSAADNIGSTFEDFDDVDDEDGNSECQSNFDQPEIDDDEDEEFHSIESGAESILDGVTDTSYSKRQYQPLITLLTASGQKFLQNMLISSNNSSLKNNGSYVADVRRFVDFLLKLYDQFWSIKQHELSDNSNLTLSGSDICFRDIYGFSLLHELAANQFFGSLMVSDANWLNLLSAILKQLESTAVMSHPQFFIAIHVFIVTKALFSIEEISKEATNLNESLFSLFTTILSYLSKVMVTHSPLSQTKVPLSATYSETVTNHSVETLRKIYVKCPGIRDSVNTLIKDALSEYSVVIDNWVARQPANPSKPPVDQDFSKFLPLLQFIGIESEARPYCGAEITSPVVGHIQLIVPKRSALVLSRAGDVHWQMLHLSKISTKPICPFKLIDSTNGGMEAILMSLVAKHILFVEYLDRLLLLARIDGSNVSTQPKPHMLLAAKLFMQFISSNFDMQNIHFANDVDLIALIKTASKSITVRPTFDQYVIKNALTPLIDICLKAQPLSRSISPASCQNKSQDEADANSLQTISIDSIHQSREISRETEALLEGASNNFDGTNKEGEEAYEDPESQSLKGQDNGSSSDDDNDDNDTVTTIECGELLAGETAEAWGEDPGHLGISALADDDSDVHRLVEMGFSRSHIYEAYASLLADAESRPPSLDVIVNWLVENPPMVDDSANSGNLRRQPNREFRYKPLIQRSFGRFLSSALLADDDHFPGMSLLSGATSSSTSNEESEEHATASTSERSRPYPPLAAFGRSNRRQHRSVNSGSQSELPMEIPFEITANSDITFGQIVKSLIRVDGVVFGETGYVLRVTNEQATTRSGLPSFSQFRPFNRLIGSDSRLMRAEGGGAKNVLVHWRLCGLRLWVSSTDLQAVAWPWETSREIQIGDAVKVRDSVTVPRYKWGSVTPGSVGTVVAVLDDLVYINFQVQHRWAGLRKELEIIPSEPMVVCYECDSDINVASDMIYYRCRKCRPPDFFVVCASCRRRLSNNSHIHGLFAFIKTRGPIFNHNDRSATSTFRSSSNSAVPTSAWSMCVSHVLASSNVSLFQQARRGSPVSWISQPEVNPPHWIRLYIKPGVLLQSLCVELDALRPDSLPNVLVLRIGQTADHLRTIRTFPVAPDIVVVELLAKPLPKFYGCIEIRIPGTRGGISSPCRISNLVVTPRIMSPFHRLSLDEAIGDEEHSSDSKKSANLVDENDILVDSSSSDSDDDEESALICHNILAVAPQQQTTSDQSIPASIVYGWGLNDKEQLARHGQLKVKQPFIGDPLPFTGLGIISLAFGSKCSFFLTHTGHVYACGDALNGRLGLGEVPDIVSVPRKLGGDIAYAFITKISTHSGGRHAMALSMDGRVYSWGDGENGKLGHGDEATVLEPKLVKYLADKAITVRSISAGSSHSACISTEGELYTWGLGEFGRLGHGDANSHDLPKLVEHFQGCEVIEVACGSRDAQTLVLTADEIVWSFGDGDFGKLGRGGNESCSIPTEIPDLTGLGVCQVECGAQFSLVRTKDGCVYTFGKGDYYRLGHGSESHYRRPHRITEGGLSDEKVTYVAVGALHSLVICASGNVYLWGDGDHFQQGNGQAAANRIPSLLQIIPEGLKVISAACGSSHTGVVCLPNEKCLSHQGSPNRESNSTGMRLSSLSSDKSAIKASPLPFTVPFDPLGQTTIGLFPVTSSTFSQPSEIQSSTNSTDEVPKQSLAYKIISKNSTGSDKSRQSKFVYLVHLLRSHIIYRLRTLLAEAAESPEIIEALQKFSKETPENTQLLSALTRIIKLDLAGRISPPNHHKISDVLKQVIRSSSPKLLLDIFLPELTEIACLNSVISKISPLDILAPVVQESPHPYSEKSSLSGSVTIPGASSLKIVFDSQCSTEKRRDVLSICDYAGRIVSMKSGRDWAVDWSTPDEIVVEGDFLSWTFQSDAGSPAGWGFRFFVTCPTANRLKQLSSHSDRKICSMPSLELVSAMLPTASALVNMVDDIDSGEGRVDRLSLCLNSLADIAKNGNVAPSYRNWAVSLCAELCLAHKADMFIERPLAALANLLIIQYDYEESVVRPGRHLVFSTFCRKLVSLALALRFDRLSPVFEQASWFQRLVQFMTISSCLLERQPWPDWFSAAVNFRLASSSPSVKDRDKDTTTHDEFLDNAKFSALQDEQLVTWFNAGPDEWTLSEAAGWRVFAFGHNHRGQLSLAEGPKVKTPSSVPLIEQLEPVQIVGGEQSTFVVSREGKLYSFGYGAGGRLGLGGADSMAVPTLVRMLTDVQVVEVAVSPGGKHCLARSIDGQVWSWGDNADGALGQGNRIICDQPKQIEFFRGQSVTRIASGSAHSAAITADGQLFTWGRGRYGRLGHGDSEDQLLPIPVLGLRDHIVIDVACGSGDAQTLALTADGSVWSFGDGDYGKLGRGGSDGCRVPMVIPSLTDKDVIQVACGSQFSACLTRQGAIYTWGKGEYFRLGQGSTDHVRTPKRVAGLLGKKVIKMAIGSLHCLVLTTDGEVFAFGDNDEGQLGDSSTQPAPRPRLISVLRNRPITHIAAGSAHSFAWTVPSLSPSNTATKPVIRYPSGQLPVNCPSLQEIDRLTLRNRLLVFELFSENFWQSVPLLRFVELPDDFPNSSLVPPLSAKKLAPFLLLPHKEATLRRVVSLTTTRDRQHGPVISIDRVSRRAGSGQTVFDQLSSWLPMLLAEASLFLANRCWKVRFVAESVDDCGGGFSDSIADACEEIQSGHTCCAHLVDGPNDSLDIASGGESSVPINHQIVFQPDGKPEALRFLGVLMGIAIRTGSPLSLSISPAMWSLLTSSPGQGLSLNDLKDLDFSLCTSLREIAQMQEDLLTSSELPLAVPNIFGHLVPLLNSSDPHACITSENRDKFIEAAYSFRQHEFDEAVKHISEGLARVVPLPLLRLFTPAQLEWLACGNADVSVDVLRSITSYRGGLDANSPLIRWFWDVLEDFMPSERAQLLRFVWGRSRLPRRMSDFRGRDFVIQPLDKFGEPPAADAFLPEASTCFFMLKLPRYSCRDILESRLRYAISACQSIDLDDYVSAGGMSGGGNGAMTVAEVLLNNPHHF